MITEIKCLLSLKYLLLTRMQQGLAWVVKLEDTDWLWALKLPSLGGFHLCSSLLILFFVASDNGLQQFWETSCIRHLSLPFHLLFFPFCYSKQAYKESLNLPKTFPTMDFFFVCGVAAKALPHLARCSFRFLPRATVVPS